MREASFVAQDNGSDTDSQFLKDSIENTSKQQEERILAADGAYGGIGQRRPSGASLELGLSRRGVMSA